MAQFKIKKLGNHWYPSIKHHYDADISLDLKIEKVLDLYNRTLDIEEITIELQELPFIIEEEPIIYFDESDPAWSLHRLIEMMPSVLHDLYEVDFSKRGVFYADFSNGSYNFTQSFAKSDKTLYDNIIDCIEWLIKEGYFNKEYLEE